MEHPANWLSRVRNLRMNIDQGDPWGNEELAEQTNFPSASSRAEAQPKETVSMRRLESALLARPEPAAAGCPALHSMVLGCMATYIEDLVELGPDAAELLTTEEKGALLAVARRRGLLGDAALVFLADADSQHLDLSYAAITSNVLCQTLTPMLQLERISFIGVCIEAEVLHTVAQSCPKLRVLRLGGLGPHREKAIRKALSEVLPTFSSRDAASSEEDWEGTTGDNQSQDQLHQLQHLNWPDASPATLDFLRVRAARLIINPPRKRFTSLIQRQRLPAEADVFRPFDTEAAAMVSQFDWEELCPAIEQEPAEEESKQTRRFQLKPGELSIADKFRLAFQERTEKRAKKAEKNRKQAWRRYMRDNPTQRLINLAESGVPLTHKK